jgi:hypothetical protein
LRRIQYALHGKVRIVNQIFKYLMVKVANQIFAKALGVRSPNYAILPRPSIRLALFCIVVFALFASGSHYFAHKQKAFCELLKP